MTNKTPDIIAEREQSKKIEEYRSLYFSCKHQIEVLDKDNTYKNEKERLFCQDYWTHKLFSLSVAAKFREII